MAKTKSTEKASRKSRGRPFPKGNPGKPKGARNKTIVALEALLEGEADAIVRKVAELARNGDPVAMRLAFDRVLGPRRERPISVVLPPIKSAADGAAAMAAVIEATSKGEVTPAEGAQLTQLIKEAVQLFESATLVARIEKLERGEVDEREDPLDEPEEPELRNVAIRMPPTSEEKKRMGGG